MKEMICNIIKGAIEDGDKISIEYNGNEKIMLPYELYFDMVVGYDIDGHMDSSILSEIDNVKIVKF